MIAALHLNDGARRADQGYRREWNGVLRLFNLLQFMPSGWWTTALGVRRELYGHEPAGYEPEAPAPLPDGPHSKAWAESIALAEAELRPAMRALADRGVPPPQIGYELADSAGEVIAEAELAWEAERGVVVLADRERQPFAESG